MIGLSEEEYQDWVENYEGYCRECREWTADSVEPDARGYKCPDCGKKADYGAEEALMMGLIEIE
jgi:Zn finger protein HypA/HybF involved in hydrogenase expression